MDEAKVNQRAFFIYTGFSLGVAVLFFLLSPLAATAQSAVTTVARVSGAIWVFILCMIVTMPLVIPYVKKRAGREVEDPHGMHDMH